MPTDAVRRVLLDAATFVDRGGKWLGYLTLRDICETGKNDALDALTALRRVLGTTNVQDFTTARVVAALLDAAGEK